MSSRHFSWTWFTYGSPDGTNVNHGRSSLDVVHLPVPPALTAPRRHESSRIQLADDHNVNHVGLIWGVVHLRVA